MGKSKNGTKPATAAAPAPKAGAVTPEAVAAAETFAAMGMTPAPAEAPAKAPTTPAEAAAPAEAGAMTIACNPEIGGERFLALQGAVGQVAKIIQMNSGAAGINFLDLDRVTIPAGGQQAWTIPTIAGPRLAESFAGIIIHHGSVRTYWREPFGEGGGPTPPDCTSDDCVWGRGSPAIYDEGVRAAVWDKDKQAYACARCPNSRFKTSLKGGGGQACKEVNRLFVLLASNRLPYVVPMPPTSLKATRHYLLNLGGQLGLPFFGVVTRFALVQDSNRAGIKFCRAKLDVAAQLDDGQLRAIAALVAEVSPLIANVPVTAADYSMTGAEAEA